MSHQFRQSPDIQATDKDEDNKDVAGTVVRGLFTIAT